MKNNKLGSILLLLIMATVTTGAITGCASSRTSASTGQYIDDSTITTKVKTKLLDDPVVSGLRISVETFKGVVQLSGFANTSAEIRQAEKIARETDGVHSVKNDIHLK